MQLREGERSLLDSLSLLEEEKKAMQDYADSGMERTMGWGDTLSSASTPWAGVNVRNTRIRSGAERGERLCRIAPEKRGDDGRGGDRIV